jgi:hypothetical protein
MAHPPIFEWHGKEYASGDKSAEWYWALGIIALGIIVACVLFNNYLLGVVTFVAAIAAGLVAAKRPRIHRFAIADDGLSIDKAHYPFESMLHFSIFEYLDPETPPALSIKTKRLLSPHLLIPIVGHDPIDIYEYISLHIPDGRHDESVVDKVVELLGF